MFLKLPLVLNLEIIVKILEKICLLFETTFFFKNEKEKKKNLMV
jgi:hypothetical protein